MRIIPHRHISVFREIVGWKAGVVATILAVWKPISWVLEHLPEGPASSIKRVAAIIYASLSWQWWLGITLAVLLAMTFEYAVRLRWPRRGEKRLWTSYLSNAESSIGSAIREMAYESAWGRWYAVALLVNGRQDALTNGTPVPPGGDHDPIQNVLTSAASEVCQALMDGELTARGDWESPNDFSAIPNTDWRDSMFQVTADPRSVWRVSVMPRNDEAAKRIGRLTRSTNILVESKRFEELWPREEPLHDAERRKLLKQARRLGVDEKHLARLAYEHRRRR